MFKKKNSSFTYKQGRANARSHHHLCKQNSAQTAEPRSEHRARWCMKRELREMAVVESLIVGKDKEVRGANVRVITTGKAVHLSRPVQKLFPIEIRTGTSEILDVPKECVTGQQRRDVPCRSAALDAVWKTCAKPAERLNS